MKMTKKILKCDICGTQVDDGGDMWIGGHPFNGWLHLTDAGGGTTLEAIHKKREWDICSKTCLRTFLDSKDI
jgi:hypothetical protein